VIPAVLYWRITDCREAGAAFYSNGY
jgi:hypothetical protein